MRQRILLTIAALVVSAAALVAQATNIKSSGTLPSTCTVGNIYLKTGGSAGFYLCLATDTWTGPVLVSAVTTTGSPANGNLAKFSGAATVTNADLTGDVTTSSGVATTIANDAVTNAKAANMAEATVKGRASGAGTGDPTDLTAAQVRTILDLDAAIEIEIDGAGSAIATGAKTFYAYVPFDFALTGWELVADASGSIVIDIWKDTYANFPPTVADTICSGCTKPTLSSAQKAQSAGLSGYTTTFSKGDRLEINVDSAATVTKVILTLIGKRSS